MLEEAKEDHKESLKKDPYNGDTRGLKYWHLAAFIFMTLQTGFINFAPVDDAEIPSAVAFPDRSNSQGPRGNVDIKQFGELDVQGCIVAFLALSAVDHLITTIIAFAAPDTFVKWITKYESNPLRWIEYSASASVMSVLLAALTGIYDIHTQFMIAMATCVCNLLGLAIETLPRRLVVPENSRQDINYGGEALAQLGGENFVGGNGLRSAIRTSGLAIFWFATLILVSAILVILCYFSQGSPPDFVYVAFLATIVCYSTFAINMWLERFMGRYDFVTAEKVYVVLSFVAKTILAWDVYGGYKAAED
eukprot:CAMPEP_0114519146 /NCGR_PEP_ID=MMETSP0109-20121206/18840_1 /TAXON_ID=29199 /ORGANISM="Chlorarachnion reptans, Strain CCCM449" /LENGTH=305 /DNA_ID=CAMNT_0001699851 /DNA_START=48 /DNA_END=965 /DNA_ORIENTATION=-